MDALEAIFTRRSIRAYENRPVSPELLEQVLEAAMAAPSAGNAQPWHFLVLTERATLDAIPDIHPYSAMCRQAPAAILVLADTRLEKYPGNWMLDCSAATANMLLCARALGLGTVWCGIYPQPERMAAFSRTFALPPDIVPLCLMPIGWPAVPFKRVDRFKPERVHHETFGGQGS